MYTWKVPRDFRLLHLGFMKEHTRFGGKVLILPLESVACGWSPFLDADQGESVRDRRHSCTGPWTLPQPLFRPGFPTALASTTDSARVWSHCCHRLLALDSPATPGWLLSSQEVLWDGPLKHNRNPNLFLLPTSEKDAFLFLELYFMTWPQIFPPCTYEGCTAQADLCLSF